MAVKAASLISVVVNICLLFSLFEVGGAYSASVNTKTLIDSPVQIPYKKCFDAKTDWSWLRLWSSLSVKAKNIGINQGKITLVYGANKTDVTDQLNKASGILPSFVPPWLQQNAMMMSVLQNHCVGINTKDGTTKAHITVTEEFVNARFFLLTVVGIFLFLAAPRLSMSVVFHYSTGVTVGVLASLLVLVYILSRFIPRKTGAVSLLVGGWAVCLYLLHWVFDNFLSIQYKKYLLGYFVIATVISFAVCYWYGPVTNNRTMYLIQLFLQLIGLLCIYNGSQHEGSTMVIIVVIVMLRWIPSCGRPVRLVAAALGWQHRPAKIKLLTEDEYYEQGRIETTKALDSLKEYCRSPECNQWKMIANLESPKRFAQFVMGDEGHVTRGELSAYEDDLSLLTLDTSEEEIISSDSDMETD
ncbi:nuclear envelope integral membrane protein 1-like [Asterias rubens]|uniref:nuclear envelope integral membrane protein 1-like n=1 Tax=Asterias rubens TaxID=7604 RepID=UPI001455AB31|nr:nuclear envelope integral membrane protein 1-like [Asterias rubens]